jgi:hypothetical protein
MADNVVAHAGLGEAPKGLVGYRVSNVRFGFAVVDVGRGILESLLENPKHAGITSDSDALVAAVTRGASRRPTGRGHGFSDLQRALADMRGTWSFRSGGARLIMDGSGTGDRTVSYRNSPKLLGLQVSIEAEPGASPWRAA